MGKRGFSLIEALVAVAFCTLFILVLGGALNYSTYLNSYSKNKLIAMNDARRVIEQIRSVADANGLTGVGSISSPTTAWNTYISNLLPGETLQVIMTGSDPILTTVRINWLERSRQQVFQITTKVTGR